MDNGRTIKVAQNTNYPWDGAVRISIDPDKSGPLTVNVRIPGWARNEAVPSDLYHFAEPAKAFAVVKVNGKSVPLDLDKGYVALNRTWKKGDVIDLTLPMPVRRVVAKDQVGADRGRIALQRGPILYCAEWPDNPEGHVRNLVLPDSAQLTAEFQPEMLKGVTVVKSKAVALSLDAQGGLLKKDQDFVAIPYFSWANRGRGEMLVWLPTSDASARPRPYPTLATTSKVTTSGRKNPRTINDGEEPTSSSDSGSYFDWWPTKGRTEWVEYAFEKAATVSEVQIYWFDDTGRGEVRVPQSWRILYKDGDQWKPVEATDAYGVAKDQYNKVSFKAVATSGLRLEVTMQTNWSAGLQEWKVK